MGRSCSDGTRRPPRSLGRLSHNQGNTREQPGVRRRVPLGYGECRSPWERQMEMSSSYLAQNLEGRVRRQDVGWGRTGDESGGDYMMRTEKVREWDSGVPSLRDK